MRYFSDPEVVPYSRTGSILLAYSRTMCVSLTENPQLSFLFYFLLFLMAAFHITYKEK